MKHYLLLVVALLLSVGVSAQQKTEKVEYQESSARTLEPEHQMLLTPHVADLEVSPKRIVYTEVEAFANIPLTADVLKAIPNFKKIALSKAVHAHNADVMVGTTIDVVTNSKGCLEITITGYPAYYRNFRVATMTDLELIRLANLSSKHGENTEVLDSPQTNTTKIEKK